jgi:hypothetical protein
VFEFDPLLHLSVVIFPTTALDLSPTALVPTSGTTPSASPATAQVPPWPSPSPPAHPRRPPPHCEYHHQRPSSWGTKPPMQITGHGGGEKMMGYPGCPGGSSRRLQGKRRRQGGCMRQVDCLFFRSGVASPPF